VELHAGQRVGGKAVQAVPTRSSATLWYQVNLPPFFSFFFRSSHTPFTELRQARPRQTSPAGSACLADTAPNIGNARVRLSYKVHDVLDVCNRIEVALGMDQCPWQNLCE
jgi:hypothetical protein